MLRTGRFAGPIAGLRFETPTCAGLTDQDGTFAYRDGEIIAFSVGSVLIGAARGAARLTLADIVARVAGNPGKLADPGLTNIARFVYSLDRDGDLDGGVTLTPGIHALVGDRVITSVTRRPSHRGRPTSSRRSPTIRPSRDCSTT
ncbi:hypothetical protein ACIQM3_19330 [Streptomyces sp. NPDC091271]|uniref:hypothetical protein n=1 Tax=Streptomyces sp. NPDC091271 TaxID=3365980 RepID=UPI00382FF208